MRTRRFLLTVPTFGILLLSGGCADMAHVEARMHSRSPAPVRSDSADASQAAALAAMVVRQSPRASERIVRLAPELLERLTVVPGSQ